MDGRNTARGARVILGFSIYLILTQLDQVYLVLATALKKQQVVSSPKTKTFSTKKTRIKKREIAKKMYSRQERIEPRAWSVEIDRLAHWRRWSCRIEVSAVIHFALLYGNWGLYICAVFGWVVTRNHRNADVCTVIVRMGPG